ncbi:MAG: hypothetical protein GTN76_11840 [Candidatus Aenigmarchaeota archaeon]|nr:hypothetical protein [Candidatus Aenigmarchaeota archaeon]
MFNPFKRKRTVAPSSLILVLIVGIFVGFYGGLIATGSFQEISGPVFAISDGEETTYLELYEGEKTTLGFLTDDNVSINMSVVNIDGANLFMESLGLGLTFVEEGQLSEEEEQNLVGEAKKRRRAAAATCTDSDNGKNYAKKGLTKKGNNWKFDFCQSNGKKVREYYCKNNKIKSVVYDCNKEGKVCNDGKCVKIASGTCTDSDGGKEYYEKGTTTKGTNVKTDSCNGNKLKEFYCANNNIKKQVTDCTNHLGAIPPNRGMYLRMICKNGACVNPPKSNSCTDSDGYNPLKKGTCTDDWGTYQERCSEVSFDYNVAEFRCYSDSTWGRYCAADWYYECNWRNGWWCSEGACQKSSATDSDGGKNYKKAGTVTVTIGGKNYEYEDRCTPEEPDYERDLIEYYKWKSREAFERVNCQNLYGTNYICVDGACIKKFCTDSDGGRNENVKGTCEDWTGSYTDFCDPLHESTDQKVLLEYYCSDTYGCLSIEEFCDGTKICRNGKCV